MQNIKRDNEVMRVLDLKEISRVICNTDKSYLTLKLRKEEDHYWLYLDSVPLSEEDNKELMAILFPSKEIQQVSTTLVIDSNLVEKSIKNINNELIDPNTTTATVLNISPVKTLKKGGRPKGSKNK